MNLDEESQESVRKLLQSRNHDNLRDARVNASRQALDSARESLPISLPSDGVGSKTAIDILVNTISPALAAGQAGPRYYGFVTGGHTPVSLAADFVASSYDANVQVHLPQDTIATYVEALALRYVLDLLSIPHTCFSGRSVTTGATASNVMGIACGRQAVASRLKGPKYSAAEDGLAGLEIDVLCAGAHISIRKAAAIVGIGRSRCIEMLAYDEDSVVAFDLERLERHLLDAQQQGRGCIVCPAYAEVNTGAFTPDMPLIRKLCDKYGAWLHLDAAFGGFGGLHPDFREEVLAGLRLADSLTLDGHKWLNVPYDCAMFYTRDAKLLEAVFGPGANAPAYLSGASDPGDPEYIPSPLNVGIENSRRFRSLPLYTSLLAYGKEGHRDIVLRNIGFARKVEAWLVDNTQWYDVLTPPSTTSSKQGNFKILNIVLFAPSRACGVEAFAKEDGAVQLVKVINASGRMYVTGTKWKGRSAIRLAVSNWLTTVEDDLSMVTETLTAVMTHGKISSV